MDRREFFGAGLGAGLGVGAAAMLAGRQAQAAPIAPSMMGRSVLDFGVEANTETDQAPALQRALNEIAASGHPAFLPPGVFHLGAFRFPDQCTVNGLNAQSCLMMRRPLMFQPDRQDAALTFNGLRFSNGAQAYQSPIELGLGMAATLTLQGGELSMQNCRFEEIIGPAVTIYDGRSTITATTFDSINLAAASAYGTKPITIRDCRFSNCEIAIDVATTGNADGAIVMNNTIAKCGEAGLIAKGRAILTANIVTGCRNYGLKLGDANGTSHILASQNSIVNCRVGIACEAEGDYIFATLNMIQGAKDGAIRAIADGKLVGPDLSQRSAESFRNLAIAGNVAL